MAKRKLEVVIAGDASSLSRALGAASKDTHKFGTTASRLGGVLKSVGKGAAYAGVAIGTGLVVATVRSVKAFQEAEKVQAQTVAGLKSTGKAANVTAKEIVGLASSISRKSGIDDEAVQTAENMMLTFTKVRNEVGKGNDIFNRSTQAVADMATKMAAGAIPTAEQMQTSALRLGKALNDPVKGITALSRVGVKFTEEQKEQIKTLVESGDTLTAQKIILRELNTEFGGSARAVGGTAAGAFAKLKNEVENTEEIIGSAFAPALAGVSRTIAREVVKWQPTVQRAADGIRRVFGNDDLSLGAKIQRSFRLSRQNLAPLTGEIEAQFGSLNLGPKLKQAIDQGAPAIMDALARHAPQAAGAFVKAFIAAGPAAKLFTVGLLASKLGVFQSIGAAAASKFSGAFNGKVGAGLKFAGIAGGALLLVSALNDLTGGSRSAADAARDHADALNEERLALQRVRDLDLDAAQLKNDVRKSAMALTDAQRDYNRAVEKGGRGSKAAKAAHIVLTDAQIQHRRNLRALARQEGEATEAQRQATDASRKAIWARFDEIRASEGLSAALDYLKSKKDELANPTKVNVDMAGAIASVNAFTTGVLAALDALRRLNATPKPKGGNTATTSAATPPRSLGEAAREARALERRFEREDIAAQRQEIENRAHLDEGKLKDKSTKGLSGKALAEAKAHNDRNDRIREARKELRQFNREQAIAAERAKQTGKAMAWVRYFEKARDQAKGLKDALTNVNSSLKGVFSSAVSEFQSKWEEGVGAALDKASAAALKARDDANAAALDAFDKGTESAIANGPAAQALKALQDEADAIARKAEDASNLQSLDDAKRSGDPRAIAAAEAAIAETARQRSITAAQEAAEAERAEIERARAAERKAIEDTQAVERAALEEQQAAERKARYEADAEAFKAATWGQFFGPGGLTEQLNGGLIAYADFASKANAILAAAGLAPDGYGQGGVSFEVSAGDAAAIGKKAPKKPGKRRRRASGGLLDYGVVYRTGEAGPEDIYMGTDGRLRVRTATETSQSGGGGGISVHGDFIVRNVRSANAIVDRLAIRARRG